MKNRLKLEAAIKVIQEAVMAQFGPDENACCEIKSDGVTVIDCESGVVVEDASPLLAAAALRED